MCTASFSRIATCKFFRKFLIKRKWHHRGTILTKISIIAFVDLNNDLVCLPVILRGIVSISCSCDYIYYTHMSSQKNCIPNKESSHDIQMDIYILPSYINMVFFRSLLSYGLICPFSSKKLIYNILALSSFSINMSSIIITTLHIYEITVLSFIQIVRANIPGIIALRILAANIRNMSNATEFFNKRLSTLRLITLSRTRVHREHS